MTLNLEVNQKDEQNAALGSGDLLLTCDSPTWGAEKADRELLGRRVVSQWTFSTGD